MKNVKRYHEFDGFWKHVLYDMWENIKEYKVPKDGQTRQFIADVEYNGEPFHIEVLFVYTADFLKIIDSKIEKNKEIFLSQAIN